MSNSLWHPRQSMTEPRFLCFPLLSDSSSYCLLPIVNKAVVASMVQTSLAIDHLLLLLPFLQKRPSLPSTSKQKLTFVTVFMFSYQWGHHSGELESEESVCNAGDPGSISGSGRSLEKKIATHSSILAWKTPWMEELSGLQSMGLQKVRHDWATNTS